MGYNKRFDKLSSEERHLITINATKAICSFLQLFISPVLARRIICALLLIAGMRSADITNLTGLCERSIRELKNKLVAGNTDFLFEEKGGRGRKSKFKDVESQIVEEIESGNYHTLQQIADMIHEKFNIKASIMAVHRFLKKTKSAS